MLTDPSRRNAGSVTTDYLTALHVGQRDGHPHRHRGRAIRDGDGLTRDLTPTPRLDAGSQSDDAGDRTRALRDHAAVQLAQRALAGVDHVRPPTKKAAIQIVDFGLGQLRDATDLCFVDAVAQDRTVVQLVNQRLAIVQLAQNIRDFFRSRINGSPAMTPARSAISAA